MKQRTSTRTIKLSKAFRTVDEETRRQAAEQRLLSLEHDNYNEQEIVGGAGDDEAVDSDVSSAVFRLLPQFCLMTYLSRTRQPRRRNERRKI